MLRINLLPGYVAQKRLTTRLTVIFTAAFILVTAAPLAYEFGVLVPAQHQAETDADTAEANKTETDAIKTQAQQTLAQVGPIKSKLDFVNAVYDYNKSWVSIYDTVSRYTDPKIIYSDATVSGSTMSIHAYAPNISEVGRYLEEIYQEPDFQTVAIDHLPGYPESVINKYYIDGKLVAVDKPPTFGGNISLSQPSQAIQQTVSTPARTAGGGPDKGIYGTSIVPGTDQTTPTSTFDEMVSSQIDPLATDAQKARLAQRIADSLLRRMVVKHETKGFQITVTATLKKTLSPPAVPPTGGASAPAGGPPGGFPGGSINNG